MSAAMINRLSKHLKPRQDGKVNVAYNIISAAACIAVIVVLLYTVASLPPFGEASNPTNNEVPERYIESGVAETGAVNIVAGIILDYRAFDTLGELTVLFAGALAVILLLRNEGEYDEFNALLHEMEEPRHDDILKEVSKILVPIIMIFGIYIITGGHISPGGGFSGGAILGSSLILYASAFGTKAARRFFSFKTFQRVVAASMLFYILVKGFSFFAGANDIEAIIPLGTPGDILSGGLIMPLNIAIGLVVASVMYTLYVLFSKGEMR